MSFVKLENTYRMEPHDKDRFHPGVVEDILGIQSPQISYYIHLYLPFFVVSGEKRTKINN